jgi:trans-aconitate methyltransferase
MFARKAHWENIYQKKSASEVSWYQEEPTLSLEFIYNTQVAHDEAIIDVGGGASLLVDYLCKQGFTNLAVLDISEKALSYAYKRLGDLAQNIAWYESDVTRFDPPHPFSLWHDRAVFHFLTNKSDRKKIRQGAQTGIEARRSSHNSSVCHRWA